MLYRPKMFKTQAISIANVYTHLFYLNQEEARHEVELFEPMDMWTKEKIEEILIKLHPYLEEEIKEFLQKGNQAIISTKDRINPILKSAANRAGIAVDYLEALHPSSTVFCYLKKNKLFCRIGSCGTKKQLTHSDFEQPWVPNKAFTSISSRKINDHEESTLSIIQATKDHLLIDNLMQHYILQDKVYDNLVDIIHSPTLAEKKLQRIGPYHQNQLGELMLARNDSDQETTANSKDKKNQEARKMQEDKVIQEAKKNQVDKFIQEINKNQEEKKDRKNKKEVWTR